MAAIATVRSILFTTGTTRTSFSTKPTSSRSILPFSTHNLGGVSLPPFRVRASAGPNPTDPSTPTTDSSTSEGDLNYVLKLTVGSILGAALIKYGSILVPDITRPNIVQALLMISAPVVVAVSLLVKESGEE